MTDKTDVTCLNACQSELIVCSYDVDHVVTLYLFANSSLCEVWVWAGAFH